MAVTLALRTEVRTAEIENEVRHLLGATAPSFQVSSATTMELIRDTLLAQDRLLSLLSGFFGALGTIMAVVGIYGLIAYTAMRRTREIGIRMSIGAQRRNILILFLREVFILLSCGITIGLAMAYLLGRFVNSLLYGVRPNDLTAQSAAVLLVLTGGLIAALLPATRATRINPTEALRYE